MKRISLDGRLICRVVITVCLVPIDVACGQECVIGNDGFGGVRLGNSREEVIDYMTGRYSVAEEREGGGPLAVIVGRARSRDASVSVKASLDRSGHVYIIDVYANCVTSDGVGPGSTLAEAQRAYGSAGAVSPTDSGCNSSGGLSLA